MDDLDRALRRTLSLRFQLGLFDPIQDQPYWKIPLTVVGSNESQAFNYYSTLQSLVLLKNNNTLPFKKGIKLAIVGPHWNASDILLGTPMYYGQICPDNTLNCMNSLYSTLRIWNEGGITTYAQGTAVNTTVTDGFAEAINVVQQSDAVILALGLDMTIENENNDRININLPGNQHEFARQIIALGKPNVILLLNGGMVALDAEKISAGAILEAFYPGFHGARAIASTLFGDNNPGGKLPYTIYPSDYVNQIKMSNMNMTDAPGRSYKYYTGQPLWPFGWGLSYTTFNLTYNNYSTTVFQTGKISEQMAHYEINVTNTGKIPGDEVVFAYFVPTNLTIYTDLPLIKQLFGFERVHVNPGQTITVYFDVDTSTLQVVDKKGNIISAPGRYHLEFTNGVTEKLISTIDLIGPEIILEEWKF